MTSATAHISEQDLNALGGSLKAKIKSKGDRPVSFMGDFLSALAHVAFLPVSYFTLLPDTIEMWFGVIPGPALMAVLWIALIASMATMMYVAKTGNSGRLTGYSNVLLIVAFCLLSPIMLGFAAMTVVTFSVGGLGILQLLWKGILFFGFFWIWVKTSAE